MSVAEALDEIDYFVKVTQDKNSSVTVLVTYPSVGLYVENDKEFKESYTILPNTSDSVQLCCYNFDTHIDEIVQISRYLVRPIITSSIIKKCVQKGININLIRYFKEDGTKVKNLTEVWDYPMDDRETFLCEAAFELILSGANETTQNKIDECGLTISFNILKGFLL